MAKEVNNYKVIVGASAADVVILDIPGLPNGVTISNGETVDLSTICSREDSAASAQLVKAVSDGLITVSSTYTGASEDAAAVAAAAGTHVQGTDQGLDTGGANAVTASDIKTALDTTIPGLAVKDTAAVEVDAVVTAVVDAADAAGATPTDLEFNAVVALANDLKAKYNAAVALINELKGILNTMNA